MKEEIEELEDNEDSWEYEDETEDDWEEEQQEPVKPWKMALVFIGLALAAALICILLWKFTHASPEAPVIDTNQESMQSSQSAESVTQDGANGSTSALPEVTVAPVASASATSAPVSATSAPVSATSAPASATSAPATATSAAAEATEVPVSEDKNRVVTQDGRTIIFTDCDDTISPKEYVNLRTEPSTSQGNGTVSCRLNYGETAHRTGFSADAGWSRVEYNEQVLYVVTSYIFVAEEQPAE